MADPEPTFLSLLSAALSPGELLRSMMEIETVGIIFFDPAGDIVHANDAFLAMGNYTREDLEAGRLRWDRLTPPEWMAASTKAIQQLLTRGSTTPYEKEYYCKGEGRFWGLFAAKGLSERLGVEFILDISERKRMEARNERLLQEVQDAHQAAQAASRAKSDFLMAMSHELRTPLNGITGWVDLLELGIQGPLTDEQRESLARIRANGRVLLTLITDLLSYATADASRISLDIRLLRATDLLASLEPLVLPLAQQTGVEYVPAECDPGLLLKGDEERVRQILLNLITNGFKYTGRGGWVSVRCAREDGHVAIVVEDNGPGIPPDMQRVIFEPFVQVDRRIDRPREGVGLGLAISCDLARAMGGTLTVDSVVNEGSAFTLTLPVGAEDGEAVPVGAGREGEADPVSSVPGSSSPPPPPS